jgi:hypothetical protein
MTTQSPPSASRNASSQTSTGSLLARSFMAEHQQLNILDVRVQGQLQLRGRQLEDSHRRLAADEQLLRRQHRDEGMILPARGLLYGQIVRCWFW